MASAGSSKGAEEKGTAHAVPSSPAASSHTAHEKESNEDHEQEAAPAIAAAVATVEENREEAPKRKRRRWWSKDEPVLKPGPQTQRYLPLVSGLLAPFSVLLDIPGLTERWYIKTDGYAVIETQPNPIILDVGQAISLAFGVAANVALVLRFLERRQYISTLVCIGCLAVHDVLNIIIVATFGAVHAVNDGFTYGDAFWITVASTAASLLCSATLVADLIRTKDFRNSGSGLTTKQRSLVISVMWFLAIIAVGSLCNSFLIPELSFLDATYYSICTISSVGFGDIVPQSIGARIFTMPYAVVGITSLAFTIAVARDTILESFEASYKKRRSALAEKAKERREEKRRRLQAQRERRERELREQLERGTVPAGEGGQPQSSFKPTRGRGGAAAAVPKTPTMTRGAAQRELDYIAEVEQGMSRPRAMWRQLLRKMGLLRSWTPSRSETREEGDAEGEEGGGGVDGGAPLSRKTSASSSMSSAAIEERYASFRKELKHQQQKEFRLKISISSILFLFFWLGGSAVFQATEKEWSYFDALWFSFVYFSTIGYGDFTPKSAGGRAFFIAWALFGIANLTLLISVLTETWSDRYKSTINDGKIRRLKKKHERQGKTEGPSCTSRLLALEDFQHEDEVDAKDLPQKLADAVKGFHDHARYFMLGRTGEPPERYQNLLHAAEFDSEFAKLLESEALAAETGGNPDTRHFLFLVAYEREFETLSAAAQQLTQVFEKHAEELETMRRLNSDLKKALGEKETASERDEEDEEICEEEAAEEELAEEEQSAVKCATLDTSAAMLDRIDTRRARTGSAASPTSLTFAEPERVVVRQRSASSRGPKKR